MKATISSMLILCLVVVLAACDEASHQSAAATLTVVASYTPISAAEAVKLAKAAAMKLDYPPSVYQINNPHPGAVTDIEAWPDEPSSRVSSFNRCGADGCLFPITFTTSISPDGASAGWLVTFASAWAGSVRGGTHNWQFHAWNDRRIDFVKEEGTSLPKMP